MAESSSHFSYNRRPTRDERLSLIKKHYESKPPKNPLIDLSPNDFHQWQQKYCGKDLRLMSAVSEIAPSLVSVSFFTGVIRTLDCSGLIIEWDGEQGEGTILTTSKLMRVPKVYTRSEFDILIRLANGKVLVAEEEYVDHYHNIMILKVKSDTSLEPAILKYVDIEEGINSEYAAVGRDFFSCDLLESIGVVQCCYPFFGCPSLVSTSCYMTEVGEGGVLINSAAEICGILFSDHCGHGHTVPISHILSSLQKRRNDSALLLPWFGIRVIDSVHLLNYARERLNSSPISHVLVKEVCDESPAAELGVRSGDILKSCDRYPIHSVGEYGQVLAQLSEELSAPKPSVDIMRDIKVVVCRSTGEEVTVCADIAPVCDRKFCYSWPEDEFFILAPPRSGSQTELYF